VGHIASQAIEGQIKYQISAGIHIKSTQQSVNDSRSENSVSARQRSHPNPMWIECTGKMNTCMTNTFWFNKRKPNRTLLIKQLQTYELPTTHTNSP
jgi:hypothetical protein